MGDSFDVTNFPEEAIVQFLLDTEGLRPEIEEHKT